MNYFIKFSLALSDFFDVWKVFVIKSGVKFGLFPKKIGNLSGLFLTGLGRQKLNSGLTPKLNLFMKTVTNIFGRHYRY